MYVLILCYVLAISVLVPSCFCYSLKTSNIIKNCFLQISKDELNMRYIQLGLQDDYVLCKHKLMILSDSLTGARGTNARLYQGCFYVN